MGAQCGVHFNLGARPTESWQLKSRLAGVPPGVSLRGRFPPAPRLRIRAATVRERFVPPAHARGSVVVSSAGNIGRLLPRTVRFIPLLTVPPSCC